MPSNRLVSEVKASVARPVHDLNGHACKEWKGGGGGGAPRAAGAKPC